MFQAMPEQLTASHVANLEALRAVGDTAIATTDRLASLHLNAARALLEDMAAFGLSLTSSRESLDLAGLSVAAQPSLQKSADYGRTLYQILAGAQQEFAKVFDAHFSILNQTIGNTLDKASKNAPAGSDVALVAIKTAIAAANSAYDNINKAAKQVADLAEANVNAAVEATAKSVSAPAPKSRKAAAA